MIELLLVGLGIYWLATDTATALWVIGGVAAIALLSSLAGGKNGTRRAAPAERPRTRIDHPHVLSPDEYECAICGTRFGKDVMACPHCGVRFNEKKTDYEEFDDEEDEVAAWEEEEGW